MKLVVGMVGLIATGVLAAAAGGPEPADSFKLPAQFAGYRQWAQLLRSPYQVPMELWTRCMAPAPEEWAKAREKYGPHNERYIRVYGNQGALKAVESKTKGTFPLGSIIAKEKLVAEPHGAPVGVAFMVKRGDREFEATGGWEFSYFPSTADARATHEACASCHRGAAASDYVFGKYPR